MSAGMDMEKRVHPRIQVTGKIRFTFVAFERNDAGEYEEDVSIIDADIKDLSVGGIRFVYPSEFKEGHRGYLFFVVERKRFGLTGKVIHCTPAEQAGYQIGIMFEKVENEQGALVPGEDALELMSRIEHLLQDNPTYSNIQT